MRNLVIGDIHGGLKALTQVLNKVEVKDEDTLIFVGDYVDGWSESAQVIAFLIELSQKINCVFIKGNHDVWCENWLETAHVDPTWYMHGGKETMESYEMFSSEEKKKHAEVKKLLESYIGQTFVSQNLQITEGGGMPFNQIQLQQDTEGVISVTCTNSMGFNILCFVRVTMQEYPDLSQHLGERAYLGGKLNSFKVSSKLRVKTCFPILKVCFMQTI